MTNTFDFMPEEPRERRYRRRTLARRDKQPRRPFRERRPIDAPLEDLELWSGGKVKGEMRCSALGLPRGDCEQERLPHSAYCFYHDKLQQELTEPTAMTYPVWPLPKAGYILLDEQEAVA